VTDHTNRPNHCDRDARAERVDRMVKLLEEGKPLTVACRMVGYSSGMPYKWRMLARGDGGKPPQEEYIRIVERLSVAQAKGASRSYIDRIREAAEDGDWRAAAWCIVNFYPWLIRSPGDVEVDEPEQQQADSKASEWATPEQMMAICEFAVQSGMVTFEQLLALAPRSAGRPSTTEPPAAVQLEVIRAAVVNELANGPREPAELRDVVCALTECSHEQFKQACRGLELEQDFSAGRPTMVKLANPPDQPRTTPAVEPPTAEPQIRDENPGSDGGDARSTSWLAGKPGDGVGDYIARRRGR
jgi:hypothetical protein